MTNIPKAERIRYVGSSESPAVLGVSPYATLFETWHMKQGAIPPPNLDDVERVQAGQFMEPAIAAWTAHKFGMKLQPVDRYDIRQGVAGMGASRDYEEVDGLAPVETKNVDGLIFREQWVSEGDVITDAPLHILLQVQHQLACSPVPVDHGWLIACVGGNSLKRMRVPRHEGTIARIEEAVTDFWQSIALGRAPKPDFQADAAAIAALYASAGEHVSDMTDSNHLPELCAKYDSGLELEKQGKAQKSAAKSEMLTIVGEAKKILVNGYTIHAAARPETEIKAHTRAGYRDFRIFQKKDATI